MQSNPNLWRQINMDSRRIDYLVCVTRRTTAVFGGASVGRARVLSVNSLSKCFRMRHRADDRM
jgi:hypothetical protein